MTDKYQVVCESGDYHIKLNEEIVCYDLRSPATATENWNNVVSRLNGLNAKNDVLKKEIERLKTQNEDILYNNAKNMELLKKDNRQLKQQLKELQEFKDNYDKNVELMQNSEYVQDFLFGNL